MNHNICPMLNRLDKISTSSEGVVNLELSSSAKKVLQQKLTMTGTPCSWATLAIASKSGMLYFGLPMLSI